MTLNNQLSSFLFSKENAFALIGSFITMWTTLSVIGLGGVK